MQPSLQLAKNIILKTWEQRMEHGEDCHTKEKLVLYTKFMINQFLKSVQVKLMYVRSRLHMSVKKLNLTLVSFVTRMTKTAFICPANIMLLVSDVVKTWKNVQFADKKLKILSESIKIDQNIIIEMFSETKYNQKLLLLILINLLTFYLFFIKINLLSNFLFINYFSFEFYSWLFRI